MNYSEEIEKLILLESGETIGITSNGVANFSFDPSCFEEGLNYDPKGVTTYDSTKAQNIPIADRIVLNLTQEEQKTGYRADNTILQRMSVNHFLGRIAFNVNKFHSWFLRLLTTVKGTTYLNISNWNEKQLYLSGHCCILVEENVIRFFLALSDNKGKNPKTEQNYWSEFIPI